MEKKILLEKVAENLYSLAESLKALAEGETAAETVDKSKEPAEKATRLEDVRIVLAIKSNDGFTADIRELLQKYGVSKLSELEPKDYAAILKDAEELK